MPCVSQEGRDTAKSLSLGSGYPVKDWADVIHEFGVAPVQAQADRGQTNPHAIRTTLTALAGGQPGSSTSQGALGCIHAADHQVH